MSNIARIAGMTANTLETPLNVEDVFSTYLYTGTGSAQTITNGIDLDGEGGLVWIKRRSQAQGHGLFDTERGEDPYLGTDSSNPPVNASNGVVYNSDGFTNKSNSYFGGSGDGNGEDFASWTFRKAPKFFDVVTWNGNSTAGREIAHNLNAEVGSIFVKCTSDASNWLVYHRGIAADAETDGLFLNLTNAAVDNANYWNDTAPTSTHFTVGTDDKVNQTGRTYVAYLFAHNDGDGDFGPDGDADIIKCGSYSGAANTEVDLGWEPQFVLLKSSTGNFSWAMIDVMRGMVVGDVDGNLKPNLNEAETTAENIIEPLPTGFRWKPNVSGSTYIYIAIRRGPMAVPESATDVFDASYGQSNGNTPINLGYSSDAILYKDTSGSDSYISTRLTGSQYLSPNITAAEATGGDVYWDDMDGISFNNVSNFTSWIFYNWKRAPNYFDVVAYSGGIASHAVPHNLGVTPEMYWVKCRSDGASNRFWAVYHKDLTAPADYYLKLNDNIAEANLTNIFNGTTDASTFGVRNGYSVVNESGQTYIAYLFASLDGVSKVGSYTGTGAAQNIDCGFSSGARFVMIKRSDGTGSWEVWDTERGIVTGSEGFLRLNNTNAEGTTDWLDPYSGGFQVTALGPNAVGGNYIFYAIA